MCSQLKSPRSADSSTFARRGAMVAVLGFVVVAALRVLAAPPEPAPAAGERQLRLLRLRQTPSSSEVQVGRYLSLRGAPAGPRIGAGEGDFYVQNDRLLAVIDQYTGGLSDAVLLPAWVDRLSSATVSICDGGGAHAVLVERIQLLRGERPAVVVLGRVPAYPGLFVTTDYHIPPQSRRIEVRTSVVNRGLVALSNLAVCDVVDNGNVPLQVPGLGEVREAETALSPWCGREELGVSTLFVGRQGQMLLHFERWPPRYAFDPVIAADHGRHDLAPNQQVNVERAFLVTRGPLTGILDEALAYRGEPRRAIRVRLSGAPALASNSTGGGAVRIMLKRGGRPYIAVDAVNREALVQVPRDGTYGASGWSAGSGEGTVRPVATPAGAEPTVAEVALPLAGTVQVAVVDEQRQPLPARIVVRGVAGTQDPNFGRSGSVRAENVCFSAEPSTTLELAPGQYELLISAGPEHTLVRKRIRVTAGRAEQVSVRLARAVLRQGLLSLDLHVHSAASADSPTTLDALRVAAAASGLDGFVLTDHNAVSVPAPGPTLSAAAAAVLVVAGEEVTTTRPSFGHFNVFPVDRGSVIWASGVTPRALFAVVHGSGGRRLVQVNHPYAPGSGYLEIMQVDPTLATGSSEHRGRLACQARAPGYRTDFQLLEVMNGTEVSRPEKVWQNLERWFRLLNCGYRYVATGGSDSHRLPRQPPGSPRNYLLLAETVERDGSGRPARDPLGAVAALQCGRVMVSSGPLVTLTVDGKPVGSTVNARDGRVLANIEVQAPPWMDVSQVTLIVGGSRTATFSVHGAGRLRFRRSVPVTVLHDTWIVVVVEGARVDETQAGVMPFAFTNPVYVKQAVSAAP